MKNVAHATAGPAVHPADPAGADARTRDRVVRLLLEDGAATASALGARMGLSAAAVRRHLDALACQGRVESREQPVRGQRGRGRPARVFRLTEAGRAAFPHAYDDLATEALRYLAAHDGPEAVARFAADRVSTLERRCRDAVAAAGPDPEDRTEALARALSLEGYAASASAIASGGQLCQHHCPVAHVAAEFPQLCEAETAAIGRLLGSHVQRLATIAHGDGVCTTHVPGRVRVGSALTRQSPRPGKPGLDGPGLDEPRPGRPGPNSTETTRRSAPMTGRTTG